MVTLTRGRLTKGKLKYVTPSNYLYSGVCVLQSRPPSGRCGDYFIEHGLSQSVNSSSDSATTMRCSTMLSRITRIEIRIERPQNRKQSRNHAGIAGSKRLAEL